MQTAIKNLKILVIDDIQSNIDLIVSILELDGYKNIFTSTDSKGAIEEINFIKPDLLILDLMMPDVSGFDIMAKINTFENKEWFMPILVLTASSNSDDKKRALDLGATEFLTKPLDILETSLRIKNLLLTVFLFKQERKLNVDLERKVKQRTEDLLKEKVRAENSEKKYRNLFNSNTDAINIFFIENDELSNFVESNEANLRLFGYDNKELKHLNFFDLLEGNSKIKLNNWLNQLKDNKFISFETIFTTKSGKSKNVDVKWVWIDFDGKRAVLNIIRDISERVKFLDAILSQNNVLKEIAWSQSHEVRAPLARLMGLTQLIENYDEKEFLEDGKKILKMIKISSDELDQIIRSTSEKSYISNLFEHFTPSNS